MHPPPVVDEATLELLRRRLAWGLLGLDQPANDLLVALQHFAYRWGASQPPPPLAAWQSRLLAQWRQGEDLPEATRDPVLETLVQSLRLEDGSSLDGWFSPALFDLARRSVQPADLKPWLRFSWQQLSQGVQRLRSGPGPFAAEGESVLRAVLQALQQLQHYFSSPDVRYLEEAGWRWSEALEEWDGTANLCLSGLQPATSAIHWGRLSDCLGAEGATEICGWFQGWACDFVHTLAPYQHQILGLEPGIHRFGMALLRWQKLLPGWQDEVAPQWTEFLESLPPPHDEPPAAHLFRWLEPDREIEEAFVERNPWRAWVKKASLGPPTGQSKKEGQRLAERLRLGRLFTTLVNDLFLRQGVPFPEHNFAQEAGEWVASWLEGYDPISPGAVAMLEGRFAELEKVLLRDFPVLDPSSLSKGLLR